MPDTAKGGNMSGFDFREALGAKVEVPDDPALADGIVGPDDPPGLHMHMTGKLPGIEVLVHHICQNIVMNSNLNGICTAALFALVLKRLGETAVEHLSPEDGRTQRTHVIAEVRYMLDAMERGEA